MSARFLHLYFSQHEPVITVSGVPPAIPDWANSEVDRIWSLALDAEGKDCRLFDQEALFVSSIDETRIDLFALPYRFLYSQKRNPELKKALQLRPIAISGACLSEGKLLVGKRACNVTQYPGFLELVPSGGLENLGTNLDYKRTLIKEFEEETTLGKESIRRIDTIGICLDQDEVTYDICCTILLPEKLARQQITSPTGEYSELSWHDPEALLGIAPESFVPTSLAIIEQLRSAPG